VYRRGKGGRRGKGMEWEGGKKGSREPTIYERRDGKGRERGNEAREMREKKNGGEGEKKEGEGPALTIKNRSPPLQYFERRCCIGRMMRFD